MITVEIIPELLASLTMFPCGLFMGYLIYFYQLDHHTLAILKLIKIGPFLAGGVAAVITSICHVAIKFKCKHYKYEHFYFIMIGLIILGASEITDVFIYPTGYVPLFIGFTGHGVCYISSLTYINIRTGRSKFRSLKLSTPHVMYLLGVCAGATITWMEFKADMYYMHISERIGMSIAITCSVIFIGCLCNEILQGARVYNYKRSLDPDIDCENIFLLNSTLGDVSESDVFKIIVLSMYSIGSKILTVLFFYHPLFFQYIIASVYSNDLNVFQAQWCGLIGLLISSVLLALLNYKLTYIVSISLKLVCLIALVIIYSVDDLNYRDIKISFWILYTALGFGFYASNINILSYTSLKVNEVILAAGYFCEVITIGIVQYITLTHLESTEVYHVSNWHAISFLIILSVLGLFGLLIIPSENDIITHERDKKPIQEPIDSKIYLYERQKCVCGRIITLQMSNQQIKH